MKWRWPWKRPRVATAADLGLNADGSQPIAPPILYPRWIGEAYIAASVLNAIVKMAMDAIEAGNPDLASCTQSELLKSARALIAAIQNNRCDEVPVSAKVLPMANARKK